MIFSPETEAECKAVIESALRRDPQVFVIGGCEDRPASVRMIEESGTPVFVERPRLNPDVVALLPIRMKSPARYAYCRDLLLEKPGSKLPRSIERIKQKSVNSIGINWPDRYKERSS